MTPRRATSALLTAVLVAIGLPAPASAHQTSMKTLHVTVGGGGERQLELEVRASVTDLASAVGLDAAATTRPQLLATAGVAATVTSWIAVSTGDQPTTPCQGGEATAAADRDPRFVAVRWALTCPVRPADLTFDLESFFALDASHTMVLRLDGPTGSYDTVIGVDDTPLRLRLGGPAGSFLRWVRLGIGHILTGADHVCFVLTLLLACVITRSAGPVPSAPTTWQLRAPRQALRAMAVLVTAFSGAHSLTLIAAALGWIALPSRLVETAIAASILYAAVENLIRPDAPWRWALTFGFGLVHGLGFASALRELLPPAHVSVPLLAFNLGVEFGQLVIVAGAMPLLLVAGRTVGIERYRRRVLTLVSVAIAMLACGWGIERAFALTL